MERKRTSSGERSQRCSRNGLRNAQRQVRRTCYRRSGRLGSAIGHRRGARLGCRQRCMVLIRQRQRCLLLASCWLLLAGRRGGSWSAVPTSKRGFPSVPRNELVKGVKLSIPRLAIAVRAWRVLPESDCKLMPVPRHVSGESIARSIPGLTSRLRSPRQLRSMSVHGRAGLALALNRD